MKAAHPFFSKPARLLALIGICLLTATVQGQTTPQDSTKKKGFQLGKIKIPNPKSIQYKYTYDPVTDRYVYSQTIGEYNIKYPIILTPKAYFERVAKEQLRQHYKDKLDALEGKKAGAKEKQKDLLPEFYVNSSFFESIFGSNTISIRPQGSVEMDLGLLYSKQDNPAFSPRNRSNINFDFDQRISLSLTGKIGDRLQVNANYDTQSTFNFQNIIKLDYTPTEDDILQKIEVGNVSMPLNSSLVRGAQSLFGVKTQLKFGKTTVTGVFSEQKSESRSVVAKGESALEEFELFIKDYDENRHFFLAQYFRDTYDDALKTYPYLSTKGIKITRIEAWITNRGGRTNNVRNIVALQDLGESSVIGLASTPAGFINVGPGAVPDNANNDLDPTTIGEAGSALNDAIRDIATVNSGFSTTNVREGFDYAKLENARKLTEGRDFILNDQLGYISLNQRLKNDEVLAVSFQFTLGGKVYQVGEFANGGGVSANTTTNTPIVNQLPQVSNTALVVKLLKSSITDVQQPIWDLMMKNIYETGAYNLEQTDFKLNIFYNEGSPLNFITPVSGTSFPEPETGQKPLNQTPLLYLLNLDKLNYNNDPQRNGDGFFDFVPGITILPKTGQIIFPNVEPFGKYLFDKLALSNSEDYEIPQSYNENQRKYVYDLLYRETKTKALDGIQKNKFKLKGRYKSSRSDSGGISVGAFNVPRGSVSVTAGGRQLIEGVDYTVNYQLGRVQILNEALKASNTPIHISTENNTLFSQQTRRFTGINIEHQFNENFILSGTFLNLNERPITQKANYGSEPINNSIFGINGSYTTDVPLLTRLVNKLPFVETEAPSNLSVRGEFAYLAPGAPKGTKLNDEATSYIDDFEGTQNAINVKTALSWSLSSRPFDLDGDNQAGQEDEAGIQNGYGRALLNWYVIDPIFYTGQRPSEISDDDVSDLYTSRVFINELFPNRDLVQGQNAVLNTLDLTYYPTTRGPYNFDPTASSGTITDPSNSWAGITRELTSTDLEQTNVEYIEFWLQDPFQETSSNPGGTLVFDLGNISEDILKDGRKAYENGLPKDGNVALLPPTEWGSVVPQNQSLIYAFDSTGDERTNQDVGYDGYDDAEEIAAFGANFGADPANDNYTYFLQADGDIFERYKGYNGVQGNTPDSFSNTDRGATTDPDAEDINRDNTMNTIDSYFEYKIPLSRQLLPQSVDEFKNLPTNNPLKLFLADVKKRPRSLPNGQTKNVTWYQFRVPIRGSHAKAIGGITDLRSARFMRIYLRDFTEKTVFRFGTLDLVRSDWRRYTLALDEDDPTPEDLGTEFSVGVVGTIENEGIYDRPPNIEAEELVNNNTVIKQNEQSLTLTVCDLEPKDARAVYKNIRVDMRQYKRIRMFIHAEATEISSLGDGELVGFIRLGNDLTDNYYQIEVPLQATTGNARSATALWPEANEINLPLNALEQIKALSLTAPNVTNQNGTFYDVINGTAVPVPNDSYSDYVLGQQRIAIKGAPNYGDIRTLMVGVKNVSTRAQCAQTWFNELRLSGLENEGGWAAILNMDANIADFANISASGNQSTSGFGSLEQGPSERSLEDVQQYDIVANVNVGQLFPEKWGLQIPFNYGRNVELITPKYDQLYRDLTLKSRLDAATSKAQEKQIRESSESQTKRQNINFIGVKKLKTNPAAKSHFYDIENLTFNYSYNKEEHRDFEIESLVNKSVRVGANYAYNFKPLNVAPFKKSDSLFRNSYWKLLKDFNFNLLPSSFSVNTNIDRQFNQQKFRDADLGSQNIGIEELFRRNYAFNFDYVINYNLTDALRVNFSANRSNIVRNYFKNDDFLEGEQDPTLDVWDGLLDLGDPNRHNQHLGVTYTLPLDKLPPLSFLDVTYKYGGDFQWQKGSDSYNNLKLGDRTYNLGNTIQNSNTQTIDAALDMKKLYQYIGLTKTRRRKSSEKESSQTTTATKRKTPKKSKLWEIGVDVLTSIKNIQLNYNENKGTFIPGYLNSLGFVGTLKPTLGYTFGSQRDIRDLIARKGWLTAFPEFNQQYTQTTSRTLDISASIEPVKNLTIDLIANRSYSKNSSENYRINNGQYDVLTPNDFGNFGISTLLIKTTFSKSNATRSKAFSDFRANRLIIAQRLARANGSSVTDIDSDGFPKGYGKNSQQVLLPAFLAAYSGQNATKTNTSPFRNIPLPNWDLKYTGFMAFKWFEKRFKRFSVAHSYRAGYTINQFQSNLDYTAPNFNLSYDDQVANTKDQSGNYKLETLLGNINLTEEFSPLIKIDLETKNSVKILAEIRKDRMLSLSFDNDLLTEVSGKEYILGLGFRIKDLSIRSRIAGPKKRIVSDLNMKADVSLRDNTTIVRYLDLDNNQITSGQTIWGVKYSADYALSRNLTALFYFDYAFSKYAISTAFPQTTIRSGFTLRYNFGN